MQYRFVPASSLLVLLMPLALVAQPAGSTGTGPLNANAPVAELRQIERVVRIGAVLTAGARGARNVTLSMSVPVDWPEQHVSMFEENLPPEIRRSEYRESETIRQFFATIPKLAPRQEIRIEILFDVTVSEVSYPQRTDHLAKPERPPREIRLHLAPSDMIESRRPAIREQAESLADGKDQA
jgi:hypothetical protein